jgi:hypothetical protein
LLPLVDQLFKLGCFPGDPHTLDSVAKDPSNLSLRQNLPGNAREEDGPGGQSICVVWREEVSLAEVDKVDAFTAYEIKDES